MTQTTTPQLEPPKSARLRKAYECGFRHAVRGGWRVLANAETPEIRTAWENGYDAGKAATRPSEPVEALKADGQQCITPDCFGEPRFPVVRPDGQPDRHPDTGVQVFHCETCHDGRTDDQIAIDCMNDFLRDVAGFDAYQMHFVHHAIERAGLSLTLETED